MRRSDKNYTLQELREQYEKMKSEVQYEGTFLHFMENVILGEWPEDL